jgi:hypothetical protein
MSRANITASIPTTSAVFVWFSLRNGETIVYKFNLMEGLAILAGADPKDYSGEQVSEGEALLEISETVIEGAALLL